MLCLWQKDDQSRFRLCFRTIILNYVFFVAESVSNLTVAPSLDLLNPLISDPIANHSHSLQTQLLAALLMDNNCATHGLRQVWRRHHHCHLEDRVSISFTWRFSSKIHPESNWSKSDLFVAIVEMTKNEILFSIGKSSFIYQLSFILCVIFIIFPICSVFFPLRGFHLITIIFRRANWKYCLPLTCWISG